jgi:hypothetical protein
MSYDDWKSRSDRDDEPDIGEHPDDERAREEAEIEEALHAMEEGILEFSLEEAVRMLVEWYGSQNTRRHVTAFLDTLEEAEHARTF